MVDKKLKIDIVHTLKVTSKSYNPKYLAKSSRDKVQTYVPDIAGKTSPPWNYGIIHSKLMVSDRYYIIIKICSHNQFSCLNQMIYDKFSFITQ